MASSQFIHFSDLPSAVVLAALCNNTNGRDASRITVAQAQEILNDRGPYIDRVFGSMIYIDFSKQGFDPTSYDATYNDGEPLAAKVVDHVRQTLTREVLDEASKSIMVPTPAGV